VETRGGKTNNIMAKLNHLHTYERSKYNMEIYRCIHPKCTSYNRRDMIVGKEIMCGKCHEPTIARQEQLRAGQAKIGVKTLTCILCSKSTKAVELNAVTSVLDELLKDLNIDTEESRSA